MTTRRVILSLGASALALAAMIAVHSFPLEAQGQPAVGSGGNGPVQIVKGGDHLLHGELPEYPRRAIDDRVEGDVLLDLAVDDRGEVSDARVLTGPDELRKASLESVLSWHYAPSAIRSASTQATLRFHLPAPNAEFRGEKYVAEMKEERDLAELKEKRDLAQTVEGKRMGFSFRTKEVEGEPMTVERQEHLIKELTLTLADTGTPAGQRAELEKTFEAAKADIVKLRAGRKGEDLRGEAERYRRPVRLEAVRTERVSADAAAEVLARAGVKVGDTITEDSVKRLEAASAAVDEHFRIELNDDRRGRMTVTIISR